MATTYKCLVYTDVVWFTLLSTSNHIMDWQAYTHTHKKTDFTVDLIWWDSLRLAPITVDLIWWGSLRLAPIIE